MYGSEQSGKSGHQLEQTGLEVTMRVSHGREIKAACGQLANTYNKAKKQQK